MKTALTMPAASLATSLLAITAPALSQSTADRAPDVIFVPTSIEVVTAMLDVAHVGKDDFVYDLGSGDGRIVIAAARRGARGIGIDIDSTRIKESRRNADTARVGDHAAFRQADLFETDLSAATVVTLYLLPSLNVRLIPKLYRELRPGTRIVSHAFDMGDWKPDSAFGIRSESGGTANVFYWLLPADASGEWKVTLSDGTVYRVRFDQRYQQLSGTATVGNRKTPIDSAHVAGDRIHFTLAGSTSANPGTLTFTGTLTDDRATGTYLDHTGQPQTWTASRTSRGRGPIPKDSLTTPP